MPTMSAALFVALVVAAAPAAELQAAQKAYADVDYGRCLERARAALGQPGSLADRVATWKLVGLCAAAEGETDVARDAFQMMLTLDRDARLPDGLSPRFTSSFREAKGALMGATPLALTLAKDDVRGARRVLRVRVDDSGDLVARVGFRPKGGGLESPVKKSVELELEVPAAVDVEIVGLDRAGGEIVVLAVAGVGSGPAKDLDEAPAAVVEEAAPFPWLIVGGVAGAVVLVGTGAAVLAVALAPPQAVSLTTDIAFSPP
jgi:hypothetical protein